MLHKIHKTPTNNCTHVFRVPDLRGSPPVPLTGHMCMRDKGLAKTSVNILVRELDTADDAAVRSNALVVLGDLCVRRVPFYLRYLLDH